MSTAEPAEAGVALRCVNVMHIYGRAGSEVPALRGVDLTVARRETVALIGPSGAGKSTLLWLLAGLLRPTAGQVFVHGRLLGGAGSRQLAAMRAREVGVLLQNPARNLLPYGTALDNVLFAARPLRRRERLTPRRARALLEAVGLAARVDARAGGLSGGEQQRLGVAVALANRPSLLLADEPTSQLDPESAAAVVELLRRANVEQGTTVLVVTHDEAVASAMGRTVTIRDGRVGAEGRSGVEFVVVGRDGSVHLPPELGDVLPPGSLARVERTGDGVRLARVEDPASTQGDASTQEQP